MSDFPALINKFQEKSMEVFEPVPILACNLEILSCKILDNDFLLIGCERGLFFVDLSSAKKIPVPILQNIKFKQIRIMYSNNVMICLSGKRDHVRQYNLQSIRKLIRYMQGHDPQALKSMDFSVPIQEAKQVDKPAPDVEYLVARQDEHNDEETLVARWCSDYIKIASTAYSKQFLVTETETTSYLLVLFKQDLTLFEWAKKPYNKFMKLKEFWLPGMNI